MDAGLPQGGYDVAACLGLQLALQQVLAPREVGLGERGELGVEGGDSLGVAFCLGLTELFPEAVRLFVVDDLLALQQLQPHIGRPQVAADADEVVGPCAAAQHDVLGLGLADGGDADAEPGQAGRRVAAHDVHAPLGTSPAHAVVERLDVLHAELAADGQADRQLPRLCVHGEDVAQIDHHRLVAQVLQGHVGQVEMHALDQQVGGHHGAHALGGSQHGAVVADALHRPRVLDLYVFGESFDKAELAQLGYFHWIDDLGRIGLIGLIGPIGLMGLIGLTWRRMLPPVPP